jgi:hypothetical protein
MYAAFIIVSVAGGFGAGILCWKSTERWRIATQPGPTEGNARHKRVELIAVWLSIGAFFVGVFVTGLVLRIMG